MVEQFKADTGNVPVRFVVRTSADEPATSQVTEAGFEIPTPSKRDVFRDLKRIANSKQRDR